MLGGGDCKGWIYTTIDSYGICRGVEIVNKGGEGVDGRGVEKGRVKGVKVAKVIKGIFEKSLIHLVDV